MLRIILTAFIIVGAVVETLSQSQSVEIFNLGASRGSGTDLVAVDEDGVLFRTNKFAGRNTYSIGPLDFSGVDTPFSLNGIPLRRELFAPVHLPHGVLMEKFWFWYKDRTPSDLLIEFIRVEQDQYTTISTQIVSGTPDNPTMFSVDILPGDPALVINSLYTYYIRIASVEPGGGLLVEWPEDLTFYSAHIEYGY